jgi:hypothetical protein
MITIPRMTPMMMMVMMMTMSSMPMLRHIIPIMFLMILHLIFKEIPQNRTANGTKQAMILLMTEVISSRTTSQRTPQTTISLSVRTLMLIVRAMFSHLVAACIMV